MKRIGKITAAAVGVGALALLAVPAIAHGPGGSGAGPMWQGGGWAGQPCPMATGGYGPGGGMGYGMHGPGMMGYGMHGPGMMGPGMHGPGMMGPGYGMGPGMMGQGYGPGRAFGGPARDRDLSTDDVRKLFEGRLAWRGNDRLKVGDVKEADGAIIADIVTVDGSLVERFKVDPDTGYMQRAE